MPYASVFLPKPHRSGIMPCLVQLGNPGALSPVAVASDTVTYPVATPFARSFVGRISAQAGIKPAGSSTITATVFKRNATGSVEVALTGAFDLTALVNGTVANVPILSGLTQAERSLRAGDYLAVDIVAAGTITTQPSDLYFTVELDLKD